MPVAGLAPADRYKVQKIKTLGKKDDAKAREMLESVALQVQPLMRKHSLYVPLLSEFFPCNPCLLGLNIGGGGGDTGEIRVRLRPARDEASFLPLMSVMGTMLHELVHNHIGPHNASFYKKLDEYNEECEDLMARGVQGTGAGFDAPSVGRLGGATLASSHNPSPAVLRDVMLKATQSRLLRQALMPSGGQRLGGGSSLRSLPPAQAAAVAAERRAKDNLWCPTEALAGGDLPPTEAAPVGERGTPSEEVVPLLEAGDTGRGGGPGRGAVDGRDARAGGGSGHAGIWVGGSSGAIAAAAATGGGPSSRASATVGHGRPSDRAAGALGAAGGLRGGACCSGDGGGGSLEDADSDGASRGGAGEPSEPSDAAVNKRLRLSAAGKAAAAAAAAVGSGGRETSRQRQRWDGGSNRSRPLHQQQPPLPPDAVEVVDLTDDAEDDAAPLMLKGRSSGVSALGAAPYNDAAALAAAAGCDSARVSGSSRSGGWPCARCTLVNQATYLQCDACGALRP